MKSWRKVLSNISLFIHKLSPKLNHLDIMVKNIILHTLFLFFRERFVGDWFEFFICEAFIFFGMTYVEENTFFMVSWRRLGCTSLFSDFIYYFSCLDGKTFIDALVKKTYVAAFAPILIKRGNIGLNPWGGSFEEIAYFLLVKNVLHTLRQILLFSFLS